MATEEEKTLEFTTSVITPDCSREENEPSKSEVSPKNFAQQLEEAQLDSKKSADALEDLVAGIGAVKRILDRHSDDDSASTNSATIAEDEDLLSRLSERLHGVLGSDLLALANAANMAREHAKLASDEASSLVSDIHKANEEAEQAKTRARKAEKLSRKLYKENLALEQQVGQLKGERRTLVKAVKELRQAQEETSKFDSWRLLEEHVHNSISIHEKILKTPTNVPGTTSAFETPAVVKESREIENQQTNNDETSNDNSEPVSISAGKRDGRSSPMPGLEEATVSCSEDSFSYIHEGETNGNQSSTTGVTDDNSMPKDVALIKRGPTSPLGTPNVSPAGISCPDLKPICDPNILRTLAIPSGEKNAKENTVPSPRVRVAPGLYQV
jgi:hypothetical protein